MIELVDYLTTVRYLLEGERFDGTTTWVEGFVANVDFTLTLIQVLICRFQVLNSSCQGHCQSFITLTEVFFALIIVFCSETPDYPIISPVPEFESIRGQFWVADKRVSYFFKYSDDLWLLASLPCLSKVENVYSSHKLILKNTNQLLVCIVKHWWHVVCWAQNQSISSLAPDADFV